MFKGREVIFENPSWYNDFYFNKYGHFLEERQVLYIELLQNIFEVQDANGKWVPYNLTAHQLEWHLNDVALVKEKAKHRVVIKSRNTSFSVSSIISNLMACAEFENLIVPFIRKNLKGSLVFLKQARAIAKHMKPITIEGATFPFAMKEKRVEAAGSLECGNTTFSVYPANSDASSNIRGLRLRGNCGIIDESNFIRAFQEIFISTRDASAGSVGENAISQIDIGTTLQGLTPFKIWLDEQIKYGSDKIQIFKWPVFDPVLFDEYIHGDCKIPFPDNPSLVPIVHWHSKKDLWNNWVQDKNVFLEEYLAIVGDSKDQFFAMELISSSQTIKTPEYEDWDHLFELLKEDFKNGPEDRVLLFGADPASLHDIFGIIGFEEFQNGTNKKYKQNFQFSTNYTDLDITEKKLFQLCELFEENLKEKKIKSVQLSIDSTPIGLQITQKLSRRFNFIRPITGNKTFELKGNKVKLNQYMLVQLKDMMFNQNIEFYDDELLMHHFLSWTYKYEAESNQYGHGDLVSAAMYALAPSEKHIGNDKKLSYVLSGPQSLRNYLKSLPQGRRIG